MRRQLASAGLGTGSTAAFAVARIGQLMKEGKLTDIIAVPTSVATKNQAEGERNNILIWTGFPSISSFANFVK